MTMSLIVARAQFEKTVIFGPLKAGEGSQ